MKGEKAVRINLQEQTEFRNMATGHENKNLRWRYREVESHLDESLFLKNIDIYQKHGRKIFKPSK